MTTRRMRRTCTGSRRERGQGLVEFALVLPVFMLLLLTMLDFGYAFYTNLTIEYATREGARVGAALANGGGTPVCPDAGPAADVDKLVIAAVERVINSAGIKIDVDPSGGGGVTGIQIYKAAPATGQSVGTSTTNLWTYSLGAGPTIPGTTTKLDFVETPHKWDVCSRVNSIATSDALGVSLSYTYAYITPIANVMRLVTPGGDPPTIQLNDRTVMRLNPTGQ